MIYLWVDPLGSSCNAEARKFVRRLPGFGCIHELCWAIRRGLSQWVGHWRMDGKCEREGLDASSSNDIWLFRYEKGLDIHHLIGMLRNRITSIWKRFCENIFCRCNNAMIWNACGRVWLVDHVSVMGFHRCPYRVIYICIAWDSRQEVPFTSSYTFASFLAKATEVREWILGIKVPKWWITADRS